MCRSHRPPITTQMVKIEAHLRMEDLLTNLLMDRRGPSCIGLPRAPHTVVSKDVNPALYSVCKSYTNPYQCAIDIMICSFPRVYPKIFRTDWIPKQGLRVSEEYPDTYLYWICHWPCIHTSCVECWVTHVHEYTKVTLVLSSYLSIGYSSNYTHRSWLSGVWGGCTRG